MSGSRRSRPAIFILAISVSLFATDSFCPAESGKAVAWNLILSAAQSTDSGKRVLGIRVLGLLPGDHKAIELAESALLDSKPEVRAAAATVLGQVRSTASIPKLKRALSDKDITVTLAAAHALCEMDDKSGYEVYYAILTGERKSGGSLLAEETAILHEPKKLEAIAFEQGIGYVPFASMGWDALRVILKNDSSPVRAAAASMLASDPDPASGKALVNAMQAKRWVVRVAALEAIAKRGDPELRLKIEPFMYDMKEEVRFAAAAAVLRLVDITEAQEMKAAN
jgi:HEAT repeat protein